MGPSLSPSSVANLSTATDKHQSYPCSPDDDDYHEDDDFEFTPLLLPRRHRADRPRTARRRIFAAAHACALAQQPPPPPQRARRVSPSVAAAASAPARNKVRWHDMAFGSVRVPAAMDMDEIRRRLEARRQAAGAGNDEPASAAPAGWAPWRLIRSLSCKGVEAVAAAAAPVRLV